MDTSLLDSQTAERLIGGRLASADLPPGLGPVAAVLGAARSSTAKTDFSRLDATVAAMAAAVVAAPAATPATRKRSSRALRTKLAVGSAAGLASLFGGLAAAGALPAAAQNGIARAISHVGIDLPRATDGSRNGHGNDAVTKPVAPGQGTDVGDGKGRDATAGPGETTVAPPPCPIPAPDSHGEYVSDVAQATPPGSDHGATVSAAARSDCGKPAPTAGEDNSPTPTTVTTPEAQGPEGQGPSVTVQPDSGKPEGPPPQSNSGGSGNGQ